MEDEKEKIETISGVGTRLRYYRPDVMFGI